MYVTTCCPLALRLRAGDAVVLEELLLVCRPALHRYVLRRSQLLANDLDDILTVALYRLWRNRHRFDASQGTLHGWFRRIALNVAQDRLRQILLRPEALLDPARLDTLTAASNLAPPQYRPQPHLRKLLRRYLQQLSEQQRRILLKDAASPEGTAPNLSLSEELGVSPSTVRAYRARARKRLRRLVARSGRTY